VSEARIEITISPNDWRAIKNKSIFAIKVDDGTNLIIMLKETYLDIRRRA
jgi:hypothetical protein